MDIYLGVMIFEDGGFEVVKIDAYDSDEALNILEDFLEYNDIDAVDGYVTLIDNIPSI